MKGQYIKIDGAKLRAALVAASDQTGVCHG